MALVDVKKVREEAEKEIAEEMQKKGKERIKLKLREREQAKHVLANIEREIEDLYAELGSS